MKLSILLHVRIVVVACFALFTLQAHTQEAPVQQFLTSFNAGDSARAAAAHSAQGTTIVDEFGQHLWSGPTAFTDWSAAYDIDAKAKGITSPAVSLGTISVKNVDGTMAYLVYPAVYTYKLKGVAMREPARMAFVVRKEAGTWKIAAWTWTGTVPKAVK